MQTREGFGEDGNVTLFDDFPTVATIAEALDPRTTPLPVIAAVVEELAFCMKTATRLGRVVRIGDRWWGHPQTYGSRQMEVVDEFERTGISAEDLDYWAVVEPSDLIALVAARTGILPAVVDDIVSEFCAQVESFHVRGIHFRTPPRELAPLSRLADELVANLDVLAVHDLVLPWAQRLVLPRDEAARSPVIHLLARRDEGWLVIELHGGPETSLTESLVSPAIDRVEVEHGAGAGEVRGLVLSDGYSHAFIERTMSDERVVHLNLRALDLPSCRAQRWTIEADAGPAGWVAVAADGRTVVGGGGPAFPTLALFEPFERIGLDWEHVRVWPRPVGDRGTPGA